jgi:hypothetical protein
MKDALCSLWRDLSNLHAKREQNHLVLLKKGSLAMSRGWAEAPQAH